MNTTNPAPLIEVRNLTKTFTARTGQKVHAVSGISFSMHAGETVGLIGESGSGKSTTGRLILGLDKPDSGDVLYEGRSLTNVSAAEMRNLRAELQVVFQEPYESLNPRMRIKSIIGEPLLVRREGTAAQRLARVQEALEQVGLPANIADRFPGELSGGQQQRVGIARAIIGRPKVIVLDEPTASLDRTIRRQVGDVLTRLQKELNLSYLLITHDIATVRRISDRSMVMLKGQIVEEGPTAELMANPQHPYAKRLIHAELPVKVPSRGPEAGLPVTAAREGQDPR